jgi:predicted dithiol-disulfide oxidoreductase (DUF899 family)
MSTAPKIVSHEEWLKARLTHLDRERELTHLRDQVVAERQQLPWEKVTKSYTFETPGGKKTLADLFDGRSQLVVYHFMYGPGWEAPCPSCSYVVDHVDGALPHLNARDVTFTAVSRGPLAQLEALKKRLGWKFPWVSSGGSDFNFDMHVSFKPEDIQRGEVEYNYGKGPTPVEELPGISVFAKDDAGQVYHTYSSFATGLYIQLGT